jgi:hypothetical protein
VDDELPVDADGFDVLPCGCRMKTAVIRGERTFVFKPHDLACPIYALVQIEGAAQGKKPRVIDTRPIDGRRRG